VVVEDNVSVVEEESEEESDGDFIYEYDDV